MKRANALLALVVVLIFLLLLNFAGQPVTPEARLVQAWYDALCHPEADQSPLWRFTWRGNLSEEQLKDAIARYRAILGLPQPCDPVVDVNVIYFQWLPPELVSTFERIKFVAVNVYGGTRPSEPNLIGSEQTGVHVLYSRSGDVHILPRFLAQSPLGIYPAQQPIALYNNDGLFMGRATVTQAARRTDVRLGIPVRLEADRPWGRYEVHVFMNGIEVIPEFYEDVLPLADQASYMRPSEDGVEAGSVLEGVVWVLMPEEVYSLRVGFEIFQTPWDMRPLTAITDVKF